MAQPPRNLTTIVDRADEFLQAITQLSQMRLLVGIPDIAAGRTDDAPTNAVLGYVHEFGVSGRIPPRPFLIPTVRDMQPEIVTQFRRMGQRALDGDADGVVKMMEALGTKVTSAVKKRITDKIPPPLAPATVAARLRRTQAGRTRLNQLRQQGTDLNRWSAANLTPLVDTGQLRNSVTYVIRKQPPQLLRSAR